jgi:hypothetical protein
MRAYLLAAVIAVFTAGPAAANTSSDDLASRLGIAGPNDYKVDCRNIAQTAAYDAEARDLGNHEAPMDALLVRMDHGFVGPKYPVLQHIMDERTALYRFMLHDIFAHPALTREMAIEWASSNCNWVGIDSVAP